MREKMEMYKTPYKDRFQPLHDLLLAHQLDPYKDDLEDKLLKMIQEARTEAIEICSKDLIIQFTKEHAE